MNHNYTNDNDINNCNFNSIVTTIILIFARIIITTIRIFLTVIALVLFRIALMTVIITITANIILIPITSYSTGISSNDTNNDNHSKASSNTCMYIQCYTICNIYIYIHVCICTSIHMYIHGPSWSSKKLLPRVPDDLAVAQTAASTSLAAPQGNGGASLAMQLRTHTTDLFCEIQLFIV